MAPPVRYCIPGRCRPLPARQPGPALHASPSLTPRPVPAGERLCSLDEAAAGSGTYTRRGHVHSALAGALLARDLGGPVSGAERSGGHGSGPSLPRGPFLGVGGQSWGEKLGVLGAELRFQVGRALGLLSWLP